MMLPVKTIAEHAHNLYRMSSNLRSIAYDLHYFPGSKNYQRQNKMTFSPELYIIIFFSDNSKCFHRNGFEMCILIIIYTVCTCDTLVPTRILNSEISWFCFDFPKWGRLINFRMHRSDDCRS
jgi:hypothetical protein